MKLQSAIEYLSTYGWTILIIAVVIGAMYQLGVFGSSTSAPRAIPGSCKVFRPNGPGTNAYINLAGVCVGQLPQFVAQFNGQQGKGVTSYIDLKGTQNMNYYNITMVAWVDEYGMATNAYPGILSKATGNNPCEGYEITGGATASSTQVCLQVGNGASQASGGSWETCSSTNPYPLNTWHQVVGAVTSNSNTYLWLYIDGKLVGSSTKTANTIAFLTSNDFLVSGRYWNSFLNYPAFNGSIANVQIYNATLDASEVQSLYAEGIGGAPINLPYLVGWWPLNGNSNDYSGNNYNGAAASVAYIASWTSGYMGH